MDREEPSSSAPLSSAGTRQTQVFGPVRAVCDCEYVQLGQHYIFGKRIRMRTFTSADAKNHFGELIDMARAAPVGITKYDRPVVVVVAVEEFERMKSLDELPPERTPPETPDNHQVVSK